jgi:chromosomal replication initiation ATPase DnaA
MSKKIPQYTDEDIISYAKNAGLTRNSRKRELVDPRFYLFYVLKWEFKWTPSKIARAFNLKQHATIANGLE